MEKNCSSIAQMNCEGYITDVLFLVFVTGHLDDLKKGPQGKDKLNTERCDKIKAFKIKLRL
jgi:hypothetical protein